MSSSDGPTTLPDTDFDPEVVEILGLRAKKELRKRVRALRVRMPSSGLLARSEQICGALRELEVVANATAAALFYPIEQFHEVDLRSLDAWLRARGVRLAYPAIEPTSKTMTFRWVDDLDELENRGFGFAEPSHQAEEASDLSVIITPGLNFDLSGNRIGYGAGYYDRALPQYAPPAVTIGVAFDFQLIAEVPITATDVPVSLVVTERGLRADPGQLVILNGAGKP